MDYSEIQNLYQKYYSGIAFERQGLFECMKNDFCPDFVVYFGSSIHITPSFIFKNVTYIDKSGLSKKFFENSDSVISFADRHKVYRQKTRLQYYHLDYQKETAGQQYKYDAGICIYANNSIDCFSGYIKKGGILVFLPLNTEAEVPLPDDFDILGSIEYDRKYFFCAGECRLKKKRGSKNGRIFVENNSYTVYRKK